MNISDVICVSVVVGFFCGIGYVVYKLIRNEKKSNVWMDEYLARKRTFIANLDPRQLDFHNKLSNVSQTEVILTLEARIYELEQFIRNQQDDGK